jgi:uncharacterized protein (TIGR03437 family)
MPSKTPVGTGTITVTYNGTSDAVPVQVVASTVGVFTIASSGGGAGVFTDASYPGDPNKVNSYTAAANAGEVMIAWATGLGAISGDDATLPPKGSITASDALVYVGGTAVTPSYYGRSGCCSGLDEIVFKVPGGITGCNVPVTVRTTGGSSNFPTMSIAQSGRTCQDSFSGFAGTDYHTIFSNGSTVGSVILERTTTTETLPPPLGTGSPTAVTSDLAVASFKKYTFTAASGAGLPFTLPSIGSCIVYTFTGQSPTILGSFTTTGLDAGSAITVNGPGGNQQLSEITTGTYLGQFGSNAPGSMSPLYLSPGTYAISNGAGGKDVGDFNFNLTVPSAFNWTNQSSDATITRSSGVTLNWTGAASSSVVAIVGFSLNGTDSSNFVGGEFYCLADASAGTFNVPPEVTAALPASSSVSAGGVTIATGDLSISNYYNPVKFTASGLDYGFGFSNVSVGASVTYQ